MRTTFPETSTRVGEFSNRDDSPLVEQGVAGLKMSHGILHEEYLPNLQGKTGRKTFREMRDNDAVIGAIFFAIEMLLRAVPWSVKYEENDTEAMESFSPDVNRSTPFNRNITDADTSIKFVEGILFDDMEHTWDDFISQTISSMLTFGWCYDEIVPKIRKGTFQLDPKFKSIYDDGMIGVRKLAIRPPESLDKWDQDQHGNLYGMVQEDPNGAGTYYIPMERALLFRPFAHKESPEGRSMLRNSYRSWYFLKRIQEIEAIAIERELNGLPVVSVPMSDMYTTDENGVSRLSKVGEAYETLVKDIKLNEQGGVVIPSDCFKNKDGSLSSVKKVTLELLSTNGTRSVDTVKVKEGYQRDIARTVLAQFLMDTDTGSQARSSNESKTFFTCLDSLNESIAEQLNRNLIPKIWKDNLLDPIWMPYISPGKVTPTDLVALGEYVSKIGGLGFNIFDEPTENYLRSVADLPDKPEGEEAVSLFPESEMKGSRRTTKPGEVVKE